MSERRYDDREVALLLKRVTELHEASDGVAGEGLTAGEIEDVVAELGIQRALVVRATSEMMSPQRRGRPVWWLGGPRRSSTRRSWPAN